MTQHHKGAHFPAIAIVLPRQCEHRRCAFYLAAEEYVAQRLPEGDYFFSWVLAPTVVMGRNQVAHREIDIDFCHAHGIDIVRRKSGGGAIFADERNTMWSLVTTGGDVESIFADFSNAIVAALRDIGVPAAVSGRNDIIMSDTGAKVCGNAFYHLSDRNIVHGTMLYDTAIDLMQKALRPDNAKLQAKGVKSVHSRVGFLKDYVSISLAQLRSELTKRLTSSSVALSDDDVAEIERIEQGYYEDGYLWGNVHGVDEVRSGRVEGCGTLELRFRLTGSRIEQVALAGDFFETADAQAAFNEAFRGKPFTLSALTEAIATSSPQRAIRALSAEQLIGILSGQE